MCDQLSPASPTLSWSDPVYVTESRAALWPCPRTGPRPGSDVLEGRPLSPFPTCSVDLPFPAAKAVRYRLKGENSPKPCGFLVGVNTDKHLFPLNISLMSQPCSIPFRACRVSAAAGAPCHAGLAEQSGAVPLLSLLRREHCHCALCCLNPVQIISMSPFPNALALDPGIPGS